MIENIVRFALRNRVAVLFCGTMILLVGLFAFKNLPIEAYPDVSDTSVQVITQWPGHAPEEVERQLTLPIELVVNGTPKMSHIRSTSIFGLSVVTVLFEEGTDTYFARQQVVERLRGAELPEDTKPTLGPLSAPIGEIFRYVVRGKDVSLAELKAIEDWTIERQLRAVPGVADVVSFGGVTKQYQVLIRPERLTAHGLTLNDVLEALERSNRNAGGGFIEVGPQAVNVRGQGLIGSAEDILAIAIHDDGKGTPVLLRDVADVELGHPPRLGIVGVGPDSDVVQATVLMRKGENATEVLARVKAKVDELNSGILPNGVTVQAYYDRTELISRTTRTVLKNMAEGILLVAVLLLFFLGNVRTALIAALAIPMALLIAFIGLESMALPANLLSIGALDFGTICDGSVVMIENIFRRLNDQRERGESGNVIDTIRTSALEVARPMVFSVSIIAIAYLPIFTLQHVEGKLFRPMAFTVSFALLGALVYALAGAPVLASYMLKNELTEWDNPALRWRKTAYPRVLRWALSHRGLVLGVALGVAAVGAFLARNVGSEFLPHLDEGAIWVRATLPANVSLSEARDLVPKVRKILADYPEATLVTSQVGRPDDGTDPTGFYNAEFYVQLKDHEQWRPEFHRDKEKLIESMSRALVQFPGVSFGFSQPIADNVEEASSGVKGQIAIKVYGQDLKELDNIATQISTAIENVRGVRDFGVFRQLGQTNLSITIDRARAAQFGLAIADVQDAIEAGVGGRVVTQVIEGERRVDLAVRMAESARDDIESIRHMLVSNRRGTLTPIGQVASLNFVLGANRIYREDNSRYIALKFSVRDRDLGSTVTEAQQLVAKNVKFPDGYRLFWTGEFESQRRANQRLALIVPLTLAAITLLLRIALRSMRDASVLLTNVLLTSPVGGFVALYVTGTHFSVSSGVGFLALFGVSMQTGLILVSYIQSLRKQGLDVDDAIVSACRQRVRPIMMTAMVDTFGLVPAAMSHGIGSDSQRPLAIVIVGGVIGGLFLSLLVLPTLYRTFVAWFPDKPPPLEADAAAISMSSAEIAQSAE